MQKIQMIISIFSLIIFTAVAQETRAWKGPVYLQCPDCRSYSVKEYEHPRQRIDALPAEVQQTQTHICNDCWGLECALALWEWTNPSPVTSVELG